MRSFSNSTSPDYVLHTFDGGSTWTEQYLPDTTSDVYYTDVYFTDESTGFICDSNGRIFNTDNGGINWNYWGQPVNLTLYKIHFISSQIGWIVGENGTILQTRNGGVDWTILDSVTLENLYDINFSSQGSGFIVGENGTLLRLDSNAVLPTAVPRRIWELMD